MDQEHPLSHKQITQAQYELWLALPETQVYFQCLEWNIEQNHEYLGNGVHITPNSDETFANSHGMLGERLSFQAALHHHTLFQRHGMLEAKKVVDDEA